MVLLHLNRRKRTLPTFLRSLQMLRGDIKCAVCASAQAKSKSCSVLFVKVCIYLKGILNICIYVLVLTDVMNVTAESMP